MTVEIKSYNQILGKAVRKILSDTGLSDLRTGSIISIILEAMAQSDFENHASIVEMIKLFNVDTTGGADLDRKASEFNLTRKTAIAATNIIRISDSSFSKKSSKIYIGLPPPVIGDLVINVEDASSFLTSGLVYLGRGTGNYEGPLPYTSLTNNVSYWTINLSSPVTKNHTAVETVILSQGGNRTINVGTVVRSPANNFAPAILFIVTRVAMIPDGEDSLDGIQIMAQIPGTIGNVPAGSIREFATPPFTGATVTNLTNLSNGQDLELDPALRTRIRNVIYTIARGTERAILGAVVGVSDQTDNKKVTSASLTESTDSTIPAQLYIDDGTGFEPTFAGQGVESVVNEAAGSEQFVQLSQFPITPPILVAGYSQPYALQPGQVISIKVDKNQETITFEDSDMAVPGSVKASEIVDTINRKSTLVIARSVSGKTGFALIAKRLSSGDDPEELQILGGDANDVFKFPLTVSRVLSLYKNGVLLRKNAASGIVYSSLSSSWNFGLATTAAILTVAIDGTPSQVVNVTDADFIQFATTYKLATASQWATVLTSKIAGVTVTVETSRLRFASNKINSSASKVDLIITSPTPALTDDLVSVIFGGANVSEGATSEFTLNRFSGEVELVNKLILNDNLTAGSEYTKAHVDGIQSSSGRYSFPTTQNVAPYLYVAFDSNSTKKVIGIAVGDQITQTRIDALNISIQTNRVSGFASLQVGDIIVIVTRNPTTSWFQTQDTGIFEVTYKNPSNLEVYVKNPDATFVGGTVSVINTEDIQAFNTDGLIQRVDFLGNNLLPSEVVTVINDQIVYGEAIVFNNNIVRILSNSFNENTSKAFILAAVGSAKNLFPAGLSGSATQPHIGYQVSLVEQTSYPRLADLSAGLWANTIARNIIFGQTTSSSLVQPYTHDDSSKLFLSTINIDDTIKYISGLNGQQLLGIREIISNTQLIPQGYGIIGPIYEGDRYVITESCKFSPYDRLIVELDQDSTNKTFLIPMYRTGRVFGTATTTTFDAYDMDSSSGSNFNGSTWRTFSFQDFALSFRARNIYKSSAIDSSVIIRSAIFGKIGENVKFSVNYPTGATRPAAVLHSLDGSVVNVNFYLTSGSPRIGISTVGVGYKLNRSGQILTLEYAGVGSSPNFAAAGVIIGDVASISDSAFSSKSSYFTGTGKVTFVDNTTLSVRLQNSATINTNYVTSSVVDSGSGTTSTYHMANIGLIQSGDKVIIAGFSRSINNGTFDVVGVEPYTSTITVSHSNRTTISAQTIGYRRTLNTVSLQFNASISSEVQALDDVIISGIADTSLNVEETVTAITTTTILNDTIQYTAPGAALPPAKDSTQAIWQSGNTVRYLMTSTSSISIGNTVVIAGFGKPSNEGTFSVTNVLSGNWIECTTGRVNGADDETVVVAASIRATYFVTETNGTVVVMNNQGPVSGTVKMVISQAISSGISVFPLGNTTAASMIGIINSDQYVNKVISAVSALGFSGTGVITNATFDESISVGYDHIVGQSYISLYDGENYVLDFYSAAVNPYKNFKLKKQLVFSHADYNISTAPNISGEQAGEYFKLVPTTYRNVSGWLNKTAVTSLPVVGSVAAIADGGKIQISSKTIGTSGAVKVTGGTGNGINSLLKTPASSDGGSTRVQVNYSDLAMFTIGQNVTINNYKASPKPRTFIAGDLIDTENISGTETIFKSRNRVLTLTSSSVIGVSDVSASYGRSAGIVWRLSVTVTPSAFTGTRIGDTLRVTNTNFNIGNRSSASTGNGTCSFFPILNVNTSGNWIEIHNPYGFAEAGVVLSGASVGVTVSPAFFHEWKNYLSTSDILSVESFGFKNQWKFEWVSGTTSPLFVQNGVSIDDYVTISDPFSPKNIGTFRVVAVDDNYFVIENPDGIPEDSVTLMLPTNIRFFQSESTIVGDTLNVSDTTFLEPNRGSHTVSAYGTDAILGTQYVTVSIDNGSSQTGVTLSGLPNTFFVTDGELYVSNRYITNFSIDPSDVTKAVIYLRPNINVHKLNNAYNTAITPAQKMSFPADTIIGIDGYRYYTGLLRTVQRTVDGYDPDPINFPGYKAAGTQIEIVPPLVKSIDISLIVKPVGGTNLSAINDAIKAAILNYINGLGVGEDVIVSEITQAAMSVEGVLSVTLINPDPNTERIVILDNEKVVITIDNITISSS